MVTQSTPEMLPNHEVVYVVVCYADETSIKVLGVRKTMDGARKLIAERERAHERKYNFTRPGLKDEGQIEGLHGKTYVIYRPGLDFDIYELPVLS